MRRSLLTVAAFVLGLVALTQLPVGQAQVLPFVHGSYLAVVFKPLPVPTVTPVPTIPPSPTVAPTFALQNGAFEAGTDGWQVVEDETGDVIRTTFPNGVRPHGGKWAAWLGGRYDSTSALLQQVTIPADRKYFTYWRWIASSDICDEDIGGVVLADDDGEVTDDEVVDATELCSSKNTNSWKRQSIDVSRFAGQTRTLIILVSTDFLLNSNMFVDDISFQAKANVGSEPASADVPASAAPKSGRTQHTVSDALPSGLLEQVRKQAR